MRSSFWKILNNKIKEKDFFWPFKQAFKYPAILFSKKIDKPLAGPLQGIFYITYKCNYRCIMCDLWRKPEEYAKIGKQELNSEEIKKTIDDLAKIGTTGIGFTGGEPFVRPDMLDLVRYTKSKGMLAHISSNGGLIQDLRFTKEIFDSGLDAINISLDGIKAETHDKVRGIKGAYERTIKAIRILSEVKKNHSNKMSISTTAVISKINLDEVIELAEFSKNLGADYIGFIPVHNIGLTVDENSRSLEFNIDDLDKADKVIDKLIDLKKKGAPIESTIGYLKLFKKCFRQEKSPLECYAGYSTIAIDNYGDIYPCFPWAEINKPIENIKNISLKKYWNSSGFRAAREAVSKCHDCYWNCQTEWNVLFNKFKF